MLETVVLLPGLQSDHTSWAYQIEHLKSRYDVFVPTGYHAKASIAEMADYVTGQLPQRFHFVAWSMGGYIALQMLPAVRDRLISFTLISTSARPEDPTNTERRLDNLATAEQEGMAAANERSLAFSCLDVDSLEASQRESLKQSAVDLGVDAYRAQQHAIIGRPDGRKNLPLVKCPTLVIVGDADEVTRPECALEIHAGIAGSEFVMIPNTGHCPPLEHPQRVNGLLEEWFSRHAEPQVQPSAQAEST
ncbi:alpha/beta hydrolase [Hoeflea sp. AS60]|uniref:alpha/beta fold hydrolase n=1 Tax=Hoeflea sp. AS60 TaxID=3135780 RepID=UPI0031700721